METYFSNKKESRNTLTRYLPEENAEKAVASGNGVSYTLTPEGNRKERTRNGETQVQVTLVENFDIQVFSNIQEATEKLSEKEVLALVNREYVVSQYQEKASEILKACGIVSESTRGFAKAKKEIAEKLWKKLGGKITADGEPKGTVTLLGNTFSTLEDLYNDIAS